MLEIVYNNQETSRLYKAQFKFQPEVILEIQLIFKELLASNNNNISNHLKILRLKHLKKCCSNQKRKEVLVCTGLMLHKVDFFLEFQIWEMRSPFFLKIQVTVRPMVEFWSKEPPQILKCKLKVLSSKEVDKLINHSLHQGLKLTLKMLMPYLWWTIKWH